jgi:chorismate dehydratase
MTVVTPKMLTPSHMPESIELPELSELSRAERTPVRVAAVEYLNTRPLIEGLEKHAGIALHTTVPSGIIDELTSGRAEVGLASIVDCVNAPVEMRLLPVGMIGCDGPTLTVRLYSRVPLAEATTLHADTASHTSVLLARVLFRHRFGTDPRVVAFNPRTHSGPLPDTLLLIGDKVVTAAPPAEAFAHQLDLGEAWHILTGLPFVYAMWMACAHVLDSHRGGAVEHAARVLDRQRRHNATRLDWIVDTRRGQWPPELARRYVGSLLRYRVDERARAAVERFLSMTAELGLTPARSAQWHTFRDVAGHPDQNAIVSPGGA